MDDEETYIAVRLPSRPRRFGELLRAELKNVPQTRTSGSRGWFSLYGVFCLSLGFMVFAWGTSYKLSLYKAECQSSPAKVCTRGSDAAKNAVDNAAGGGAAAAVADAPLGISVLSSLLQGTEDYPVDRLRDEAIIDRSPLSRAPILYRRPPPIERPSID